MTAHSQKGKEIEQLARDYKEAKISVEEMLDKEKFYSTDIETAANYLKELPKEERLKIVRRWRARGFLEYKHGIKVQDNKFWYRVRDIGRHNNRHKHHDLFSLIF